MELVQSAVVSRVTGAWGLENDINRLRNTTLPQVNHLMEKAEWWRFKNSYIAHLLKQLRHATYDAEDVIAMFDYHELRQRIEGQNKHSIWSSAYSFFKNLVTNHPSTVKDVQTNLDSIICQFEKLRMMDLPDAGPNLHENVVRQETSSMLPELVLGRNDEVEKVVKIMLQPGDGVGSSNETSTSGSSLERSKKRRRTTNFSVSPIVGMGGIGKTTLAQLIYNDERVKNHFDIKIWVCVSGSFNLKKITEEMIESAKRRLEANENLRICEKQIRFGGNLSNLDSLQQILKEKVASRRFLLVLDDVWHFNTKDWELLCNPLRSGSQGSFILMTTRISTVAEVVGTLDPIEITNLPDDVYWDLFKKCSFGSCDPSSLPELEAIGKKIATRLKGSPLAAKTLGKILHANMTTSKWRNILNSELWEIEQEEGDILPALRVSYHYLPVYLKRCFQAFSLFPKDWSVSPENLEPLWVSDGIINRVDVKCSKYFQDFVNRSFFISDQYDRKYLHDLMHELSKSVSDGIFYCLESNISSSENHNNVRHLMGFYDDIIGWTGEEIGRCKNLRSLLFRDGICPSEVNTISSTLFSLFDQLTNLRFLHLDGCQIEELPENIGNLKLLIHINLRHTKIKSLPNSICQLYNLQVVKLDGCPLESFPKLFHRLSNMRLIAHHMEISTKISGIGKLTSLETLREFKVLKKDGHKIEELKDMNRLRGWLQVSDLQNVEGREDAARACLHNKEYVNYLILSWSSNGSTSSRHEESVTDQNIIEGLQPHPNLTDLYIENYMGRSPPSWLQTQMLSTLEDLSIEGCFNLERLDDWFLPCHLPSLRTFRIKECANLVSLPLEWINNSSITSLTVNNCPQLRCSNNLMFPSGLRHLELNSCGEFDMALPGCLMNLNSLHCLELSNCQHVTSLPSQVTHHITKLRLHNCTELQCLELSNPSILEILVITKCLKLIQSGPLSSDSEAPLERIQELFLTIDNTSLLKLPFLRNPPSLLKWMIISNSPEERLFTGDLQGWLNGIESLHQLIIENCHNLESLPEELHTLVTLKWMELIDCPKIQSLPHSGLPPLQNGRLLFRGCHPALTELLKHHEKAYMLK